MDTQHRTEDHTTSNTITTRSDFIGKVYRLLGLSLITGVASAAVGTRLTLPEKMLLPLIAAEFALIILLVVVRRTPVALPALFAFTATTGLALSFVLGPMIKAGLGALIMTAAGATAVIFLAISLYAFESGRDFSFMGGFLFTGLLTLLSGTLFSLFCPSAVPFQTLLLSGAGVMLFSGYILYDTSLMIHRLSPDEYILATVNLYLDIYNMFIDLLQILIEFAGD